MDLRDSKTRLTLTLVALGSALAIALTACSGSDGGEDTASDAPSQTGGADGKGEDASPGPSDGPGEGEPEEMLAQVSAGDLVLTVTSAVREEGGFLTIEGTLTNTGTDRFFDVGWRGDEKELAGNGFSMAGSSIVDRSEAQRHLILRDTSGRCLCTQFPDDIAPGQTVDWFAQFAAPPAATVQVDFVAPDLLPPATIRIS